MTYDFNYYKNYVHFRVVPELYGYTILRAALELVEEFLEFDLAETPDEDLEELGDVCFWFAYFAKVTDYELHGEIIDIWEFDPFEVIKDMAGCIKRFYRDENLAKLDEFKDLMCYLESFINYELIVLGKTWEDIIADNVAKLDARFGNTYEFNKTV